MEPISPYGIFSPRKKVKMGGTTQSSDYYQTKTMVALFRRFLFIESYMHTVCVLCALWTHASDFVTSRPSLMRLVWSAFEQNLFLY